MGFLCLSVGEKSDKDERRKAIIIEIFRIEPRLKNAFFFAGKKIVSWENFDCYKENC